MYNDSPIKYERQDKLNRAKFAQSVSKSIIKTRKGNNSIVIGLMGGWGTGKSSILNLIENSITDVNIVRFNPWNYYSQQTLFTSFFDELTNTLPLNNQIKTKFHKYKNKIYATGISLGSSVVPQVGAMANIISDSEPNTLNKIKEELNVVFKKQKKTVVIIDDIDRLNPDEVKQIFQLVKSLADFPNLIYILAFDKNYVNYALKDWNMDGERYSPSEDFIDKIIQVPLTIPKIDGNDLFSIFKLKFNKVLNNHDVDVKDFNIEKLYLMWLSPFFKTIRDINRFCNALDFYLYSVDKEMWIHDFALVTALQIFAKDIYEEIKQNEDLLTGDFEAFKGDIDLINIEKGNLDNFLKILFDNDNLSHKNTIKQVLANLFPKVNYVFNMSYTPHSELTIKKEHCGIMQKEYFDLYFTFDNTNSLSKSRIDSVIYAANKDVGDLKNNLLSINKIYLIDSLINQLHYHFYRFDDNGIKNLIKVFVESYKELFPDEPFNQYYSKISRAINLIYHLVKERKFIDEPLFEALNGCENNYFKTCLISDLEDTGLLKDELMLKLKKDVSKFLSDYFEKTNFSNIEHVRSNMGFWRNFSDFEVTNEYINNLNDEDLISFVSEYVECDVFKEKYEMKYDNLSYVVELSSIKERFLKIKKSDEKYDDEQVNVVALFLEECHDN